MLKLIQGAKERGHRAYANVNMARVMEKAQQLPENGVPPELIRILPHDNSLDKLQPQKAATPVAGRSTLEGAGQLLCETKPNGVVLEKSGMDDGDINAQRLRALHSLVDRLGVIVPAPGGRQEESKSAAVEPQQTESVANSKQRICASSVPRSHAVPDDHFTQVTWAGPKRRKIAKADAAKGEDSVSFAGPAAKPESAVASGSKDKVVAPYVVATGNAMIDQFQPWYFGIAFAFLFKYCTGMPDMYAFAEKTRFRRTDNAPRVEPPLWVQIMYRRTQSWNPKVTLVCGFERPVRDHQQFFGVSTMSITGQ